MAEANVVTTASNAVWYTDKCEIVTGSTPVTYQVYATALPNQSAQGNIYSDPAEVPADSSQQIYVGVGNYLTITGSNWTGVEIGGQTSAQAGVGGYGANNLTPAPVPIDITPVYNCWALDGRSQGLFLTVPGESYPCLANVTTNWGINYSNGVSTGRLVLFRDAPFGNSTVLNGGSTTILAFISGQNYSFSNLVSQNSVYTSWIQGIGGGDTNMQSNTNLGNIAGYSIYNAVSPYSSVGTVTSVAFDGGYYVYTAAGGGFSRVDTSFFRFKAP
jgi:hypothetical protein